MIEKIELRTNQIWKPKGGGKPRQIIGIRASDERVSNGPRLISWACDAIKGGECSERAFRRWAAEAVLQDGIQ